MSSEVLREFAECRERSIVQILEVHFNTHIYGLCLGHVADDAPEDAELEEELAEALDRITTAMANLFSDLSVTCWDAAVLIGLELDALLDDMPYLHFHDNDYFEDGGLL